MNQLQRSREWALARCRGTAMCLLLLLALAGAAQAAGSAASPSPAPVRLGDAVVLTLAGPHDGKSAVDRARAATAALGQVLEGSELPNVTVRRSGDLAVVVAGDTPIVELSPEDARLAGEASLDGYAIKTANAVRQALASEDKRSRIAGTVFSSSLVIFFALIAFYLIKQVTRVALRVRTWLEENGDRTLRISVKNIELVRPAVLKSTALILIGLGKWVGQFGIFYAWLVVVLSLFETTRGYTERLTGFVIAPLSLLMGRAITALPLVVIAGFAAIAVFVLVRFVGLFLASVARRETSLGWLPADLAPPASILLRSAIVLCALVFAAPIVTGSSDGSLGRSGTIVMVALGLSATPLFGSALVGAVVLFGRRLNVGEYIQIRGHAGLISAINLLELRLQTSEGTERRIPHLLLLSSVLERYGQNPRLSVEVLVSPDATPGQVLGVLGSAGDRCGRETRAELVSVERDAHRYRVTVTCLSLSDRSGLLQQIVEGLAESGLQSTQATRDVAASRHE